MQKLLKISQIKIEDELYPRMKYDWFTANQYKNAMKAGSIFPPIQVALIQNKYYLIDGRHRIEAMKLKKEEFIQAIVTTNLTKEQIFVEAVKTNSKHGRILSVQDKVRIVDMLKKMNYSNMDISKMVHIPINKIESFMVNKITHAISGETVYLKSTTQNFAGQEVNNDFNTTQEIYSSHGQVRLLEQTINLIEAGHLDYNNEQVLKRLSRLKSIISAIKIPLIIKK